MQASYPFISVNDIEKRTKQNPARHAMLFFDISPKTYNTLRQKKTADEVLENFIHDAREYLATMLGHHSWFTYLWRFSLLPFGDHVLATKRPQIKVTRGHVFPQDQITADSPRWVSDLEAWNDPRVAVLTPEQLKVLAAEVAEVSKRTGVAILPITPPSVNRHYPENPPEPPMNPVKPTWVTEHMHKVAERNPVVLAIQRMGFSAHLQQEFQARHPSTPATTMYPQVLRTMIKEVEDYLTLNIANTWTTAVWREHLVPLGRLALVRDKYWTPNGTTRRKKEVPQGHFPIRDMWGLPPSKSTEARRRYGRP
jgi:hypothetical protein